jgi:hypothetical protein
MVFWSEMGRAFPSENDYAVSGKSLMEELKN